MEKPNFSELGRKLGVDRRTVKKYYEGNLEKERKQKYSKIDDYYDIVTSLLSSETPFGKQAQFDWKEKLKFTFKDNSQMLLNVGSLVLSASRFKVWTIYPSTSQNHLFDFLANAFETLGGVPEEMLIDNASTMMDQARTEYSKGKVNSKFQQLADDYGFKIVPCIRARPNTKALTKK